MSPYSTAAIAKYQRLNFHSVLLHECQFIIQMELQHISMTKNDAENKFRRFSYRLFIPLGRFIFEQFKVRPVQ